MGFNYTCVSEVGNVKLDKGRFATRVHRVSKDSRSIPNCFRYNCRHEDVLQVTGFVDSKIPAILLEGSLI